MGDSLSYLDNLLSKLRVITFLTYKYILRLVQNYSGQNILGSIMIIFVSPKLFNTAIETIPVKET